MEKFIMAGDAAIRYSDTGLSAEGAGDPRQEFVPVCGGTVAGADPQAEITGRQAGDSRSGLHGHEHGEGALGDGGAAGKLSGYCGQHGVGEIKPTIVLLHGYLESLEVWEDFTRLLRPHARVIAPDLPGHGITEVKGPVHTMEFLADTVHCLLERVAPGKVILAGHSMGGYVALAFLKKYPEKLDGLVLLHSTPDPDTDQKKENRKREIEIVRGGKKELLLKNAAGGFAEENRRRYSSFIGELEDQITLTDDDGIIALLEGMTAREDTNEVIERTTVPILAVFGRKDPYISVDKAESIIERHPAMAVCWLDNSGHMGFVEEARRTADAVLSFAAAHS